MTHPNKKEPDGQPWDPNSILDFLKNANDPEALESFLENLSPHIDPILPTRAGDPDPMVSPFTTANIAPPEPIDLRFLVPAPISITPTPKPIARPKFKVSPPEPTKKPGAAPEPVEPVEGEPIKEIPTTEYVPYPEPIHFYEPKIPAPPKKVFDRGRVPQKPIFKAPKPVGVDPSVHPASVEGPAKAPDLDAKFKARQKKLEDILKEDKGHISSTSI